MTQHDLVIRGGSIIDGTGRDSFSGDIAIDGERISAVGLVERRGHREIDASGALVTPGFVDVHTHYDGQATWAQQLSPSSHHGVTTVVMGNCGVGFAPVRKHDRQRLIELMEGVEDIPGAALHEGLTWEWETFGEYLDMLDARSWDMDVAAQLPHGPLRLYVMGERGAQRQVANAEEISEMRQIAAAAVHAGALGFTTSRTLNHRSSKGEPTPSLTASRDELTGIALGLKDAGRGVLQLITDFDDVDQEFANFEHMMRASGRPLSLSLAESLGRDWRRILGRIEDANSRGMTVRAQVAPRPIGVLLGLAATLNPLSTYPTYAALKGEPLEVRVAALRDPEVRARLLGEQPTPDNRLKKVIGNFSRVWELGEAPNYEPHPDDSIAANARREGRSPLEVAYDAMLQKDGKALLYVPFDNYDEHNLDAVREMMVHKDTIMGLSDGGAHVGTICDASFPTTLLTHWARDRKRGARIPLPSLVKSQTLDTANAVGLNDRGILRAGMRADLNMIDFPNLKAHAPEIVHDLPAGGARLQQGADGYLNTIVRGEVTYENGQPTGVLPGRLVRGPVSHRSV
ncbi:MAG: amidohydrolase family protein [Pseudomonadales bacterium]|nr:amidohydrolase family protein [Pseudomonadales bacterium]